MVSFTNFAVLALFLSTTSLQTLASPTPSSQLVKRWDRTYFKIHAIANQDTWEKNEIADCINGKLLYNVKYDDECPVEGPIYVGDQDGAAFPGSCGFEAVQFWYDADHCSFDNEVDNVCLNLIVKEDCGGEAWNTVHSGDSKWIVNGYKVCDGDITLRSDDSWKWTVCKNCASNGEDYFQLYYEHYGSNCIAVQVYETDCDE